jgi:hypothetical protein
LNIFKDTGACRLLGSTTPERVLKPSNYGQGPYRPTTGFTNNVPTAGLSNAGHRMVNHEFSSTRNQRSEGRYDAPYHRNNNQQSRYNNR